MCTQVGIAPQPPEANPKKGPPADRYDVPAQLKGMPKEVILYQYEVCPFCCKVKAVLDYYKVRRPHHHHLLTNHDGDNRPPHQKYVARLNGALTLVPGRGKGRGRS